FPRRIRRGLIEAVYVLTSHTLPGEFPRRIRRGLIEALRRFAISILRRSFRDGFVAASLKLQQRSHPPPGDRQFPRRIRRGLIEARTAFMLPASPVRFPRRIRRGLIEAQRSRRWQSRDTRFPRRIRRGLIEAGSVSSEGRTARIVSATDSLRPH